MSPTTPSDAVPTEAARRTPPVEAAGMMNPLDDINIIQPTATTDATSSTGPADTESHAEAADTGNHAAPATARPFATHSQQQGNTNSTAPNIPNHRIPAPSRNIGGTTTRRSFLGLLNMHVNGSMSATPDNTAAATAALIDHVNWALTLSNSRVGDENSPVNIRPTVRMIIQALSGAARALSIDLGQCLDVEEEPVSTTDVGPEHLTPLQLAMLREFDGAMTSLLNGIFRRSNERRGAGGVPAENTPQSMTPGRGGYTSTATSSPSSTSSAITYRVLPAQSRLIHPPEEDLALWGAIQDFPMHLHMAIINLVREHRALTELRNHMLESRVGYHITDWRELQAMNESLQGENSNESSARLANLWRGQETVLERLEGYVRGAQQAVRNCTGWEQWTGWQRAFYMRTI